MKTKPRIGHTLLTTLVVCGMVACTTSEATQNGSGGSSSPPASTGGSAVTPGGTGGAAGGATGSTATDGTLCPLPAKPLITDFAYVPSDAGASTSTVHFGDSTTLGGSEFVYPTTGTWPVTSDMTASNWHISGTLGDYSGFGLFFDNCSRVDASAYKGVSFTISGSVPQGSITMGLGTLNDVIASSWLSTHGGDTTEKPGRCLPTSGTNQYDQKTCADATKSVPVTATPTKISILWSDFTGGKPEPGVTPTDIISFYWFFPPPTGAGTASPTTYAVDIVVDDLSFIP
jgi:hypothetical protein